MMGAQLILVIPHLRYHRRMAGLGYYCNILVRSATSAQISYLEVHDDTNCIIVVPVLHFMVGLITTRKYSMYFILKFETC